MLCYSQVSLVNCKCSNTYVDVYQNRCLILIYCHLLSFLKLKADQKRPKSAYNYYESKWNFNALPCYLYHISRSSEVLLTRGLFIATLIPRRDAVTFVDTKTTFCAAFFFAQKLFAQFPSLALLFV